MGSFVVFNVVCGLSMSCSTPEIFALKVVINCKVVKN